MSEFADLIAKYGYSAILMAYFLFKDWKFNENLLNVLTEMQMVLAALKDKVLD